MYLHGPEEMDTQCTNSVHLPTEHGPTILDVPESSAGASPSFVASKEVNSTTACDSDQSLFDSSVAKTERNATGMSVERGVCRLRHNEATRYEVPFVSPL